MSNNPKNPLIQTVDSILAEIRAVRYRFGRGADPEIELIGLRKQLREVTAERDHWKANHDNQVVVRRGLQIELGKALQEILTLKEAVKTAFHD